MSRRKQEKPQHRKTIDSADQGHDLLICGDCHEEFPLQSIISFIQHKVRRCDKENVKPCPGDDDSTPRKDDDKSDVTAVNCVGVTSITAPILLKGPHCSQDNGHCGDTAAVFPMPSPVITDPPPLIPKEVVENSVFQMTRGQRDVKRVDQAVNTNYTEPACLQCATCKEPFSTAWSLIQHVQSRHGLQVYLEISSVSSPRSSGNDSDEQQQYKHTRVEKISQGSPQSSPPSSGGMLPSSSPLKRSFPVSVHSAFTDRRRSPSHSFLQPRGLPNFPFAADHFMNVVAPCAVDQLSRYNPTRPHLGVEHAIYSQTLREMARNDHKAVLPTSPGGSGRTSPYPQNTGGGPLSLCLPPPNLKACEFCGKRFRFQSNLIVHRRSHTGEKPYKCKICPHACTQASKLKRHMKTHRRSSTHSSGDGAGEVTGNLTDGNTKEEESGGSSANQDSHSDGSETEEEDEDEEYADEEEMEEETENDGGGATVDSPTDLRCEVSKSKDRQQELDAAGEHKPTDLRMPRTSSSSLEQENMDLVREVMEHTGLNKFEAYQEAFRRALEMNMRPENFRRLGEGDHAESDNDVRNCHSPPPHSPSKQVKLENTSENHLSKPPDYMFHKNFEPMFPFFMGRPFSSPGLPLNYAHQRLPERPPQSLANDKGLLMPSLQAGPSSLPTAVSRKEVKRSDTCEYCGKVFKNCSNLTVHRRSHTGEKPYKCSLCSYACAQSSKLTRHMKTHGRSGKEVFRCRFCNMPFSVASTLEKHMRKCMERSPLAMHGLMHMDHSGVGSAFVRSPTSASTTRSPIAFTPTPTSPNTPAHLSHRRSESPRWLPDTVGETNGQRHAFGSVSSDGAKDEAESKSPSSSRSSQDGLTNSKPLSLTT